MSKKKELHDSSQIPGRGLYSEDARRERVQFLRQKTGASLSLLDTTPLDAHGLKGNIENFIGVISIPVGVAGPLLVVQADGHQENIYAPIATTEGALVASLTRGARAISLSGGVRAKVLSQKMIRAPMFEFENIYSAVDFVDWINAQTDEIKKETKKYSNYAELKSIQCKHLGRSVHLRFEYATRDAAGQNMTTICTWNICRSILEKLKNQNHIKIKDFILDGNISSDKKVSYSAILEGRGAEVVVEAVIQGEVLEDVLKVSADRFCRLIQLAKSGRMHSGLMGWNINIANVMAGIFAATGQDMACVHESSIGEFHVEPQGNNVYVSLYLPAVVVGTVGGGTRLKGQQEFLEMLGCYGEGKLERFVELIAGFALALDLSTAAAMVGGQFADAHERLGRTGSGQLLKKADVDAEFIFSFLKELKSQGAQFLSCKEITHADFGQSLVMDLSSQVTKKLCGFFPYRVTYELNGQEGTADLLLKIKPKDEEVILAAEMMASMCSEGIARQLRENKQLNLFSKNDEKEIHIHELGLQSVRDIAPSFYGGIINPEREIYLLASAYLGEDLSHQPDSEDLGYWNFTKVSQVLSAIARVHVEGRNLVPQLELSPWLGYQPNLENLISLKPLFRELLKFARKEFPEIISDSQYQRQSEIIEEIDSWGGALEAKNRTLIHNDFNLRNIGMSRAGKPCVFDWELATVGLPARDVIEFLSFSLLENFSEQEVMEKLKAYHQAALHFGEKLPTEIEQKKQYIAALNEFIIYRLSLYFVAHSHRELSFLPRVYKVAFQLRDVILKSPHLVAESLKDLEAQNE